MSAFSIRPAVATDAPRLAELRWEFRVLLRPPRESGTAFIGRCAAWMAARLPSALPWRCWVAEHDRRIIGQLWLQLIEKVPNPIAECETHGYITNVFVIPEERGKGVGTALLSKAIECCREARVDSVILWPTPESRTIYERHGFEVRDDVMELVLGGHGF